MQWQLPLLNQLIACETLFSAAQVLANHHVPSEGQDRTTSALDLPMYICLPAPF